MDQPADAAEHDYQNWTRSVFGADVPVPGVQLATSFPGSSSWGAKFHVALLNVELEYVDFLLSELQRSQVEGALVEFGIFEGWWINHLFERSEAIRLYRKVIGFDSFKGLSTPHPEFDQAVWQEGQYSCSLATVSANVRARRRPRIQLIEGYFADSLPTAEAQAIDRVAYARIDCDIYEPALQCLNYLSHRLSHGAVLVFDDWPHETRTGEGRAFAEWHPTVPHLRFEFLFFGTWGHFYMRVWHRDRER
jgi:hypothetical protein